ncbi:MAG: hypothetical protein M3069_14190 [Chloroflexota bacterium]|nr:hypothetical protein [Chloroflexota bacterium]
MHDTLKTSTLHMRRALRAAVALPLILMTLLQVESVGAASLTNATWSVSNSQTSATGVTYAYNFTTATSGLIATITMTVPTGTAGTPAIAQNFGIGAGSVARSGTTITYTVTTPALVAAGISIYIELSGLTNTGTAGFNSSTITTQLALAVTIDSATTNSVNFGSGTVAATIQVAKATVFSIDTNSFTMLLDPVTNQSATRAINLGVSSNAKSGYNLQCQVNQQPTNGGVSLAAYQTNMAAAAAWASGGASKFGYAIALTNNGASGSPALGGALSSTNYAGFTTAGENCATATAGTGNPLGTTSALTGCTSAAGLCDRAAHYWAMTVKAAADYTTGAGQYTANVILTVTPSY